MSFINSSVKIKHLLLLSFSLSITLFCTGTEMVTSLICNSCIKNMFMKCHKHYGTAWNVIHMLTFYQYFFLHIQETLTRLGGSMRLTLRPLTRHSRPTGNGWNKVCKRNYVQGEARGVGWMYRMSRHKESNRKCAGITMILNKCCYSYSNFSSDEVWIILLLSLQSPIIDTTCK